MLQATVEEYIKVDTLSGALSLLNTVYYSDDSDSCNTLGDYLSGVHHIADNRLHDDLFTQIAKRIMQQDDPGGALEILQLTSMSGVSALHLLTSIVSKYVELGDRDAAFEVAHSIIGGLSAELTDFSALVALKQHIDALHVVLRGCLRSKEWSRARIVANSMPSMELRKDALKQVRMAKAKSLRLQRLKGPCKDLR